MQNDHEIGGLEGFKAGDIIVDVRIDFAGLRIDGEEDGTLEAMMLGENLAELRQRFFGAVFFIAGDEDDVLALAGAFAALIDDPGLVFFLSVRWGDEETR